MSDPSDTSALPRHRLDHAARARLEEMTAQIIAHPEAIARLYPAAAREVARGPADEGDPGGMLGPTIDDDVRAVLLETLASAVDGDRLLSEVRSLYRYGDSEEKRSVLRALGSLGLGEGARPLVDDALRTNDLRLVAAGMGQWSAEHLEAEAWNQGVLKCLFLGIPIEAVHGLWERADAALTEMTAAYAHERLAAGRQIPADAVAIIARFPVAAAGFADVSAAVLPGTADPS